MLVSICSCGASKPTRSNLLQGTWGTSDRDEYERSQRNVFGSTSRLRLQIEEIANDFNQRFTALLEMVKERPNGYVAQTWLFNIVRLISCGTALYLQRTAKPPVFGVAL